MIATTPDKAERKRLGGWPLWRSHPTITALGVAFAATLLVGMLQGVRPFYADAGGYWGLASEFTQTGHFSLLNYTNPLRGYALPLALYGLKLIATNTFESQSTTVTILNVVLFSLIGAVLGPRLAEVIWPQRRWDALRRIALMAFLLIFWSGNLNYPMSDFPGLAMALLALVAISRSDRPAWMLLAGLAAGLTLNLRPAYLPLVAMLVAIVALTWFHERDVPHASVGRRALCVTMLVAGFTLVSLPQSLSANRYYNTWSPIPGSKTAPGANETLTEAVLTNGMSAQRWDSFERPLGTPNAIDYPDPSGKRLLEQQPEHKIKTAGQYVGLIVHHPGVMVPLLVRHVINGLDNRFSTVYVERHPNAGLVWLRIGGFILLFLALVRLFWPTARRRLGPIRWRYPLALALCVVTSIPSAIETRYMLPIYLLTYLLVLTPGWPNPIGPAEDGWRRFRTLGALSIAAVVFTAVVWHVVGSIHSYTVYPY